MKTTRILVAAALTSLLILGGIPQHPIGHAAQVAGPVKGGTVIDGLFEEPDRLIPNTSSETFSVMVQQTIFTPLFYSDDNGVLHPGLASQKSSEIHTPGGSPTKSKAPPPPGTGPTPPSPPAPPSPAAVGFAPAPPT